MSRLHDIYRAEDRERKKHMSQPLNPEQLCANDSEHGHQRALFAWLNMASRYGINAAWDMGSYNSREYVTKTHGTHNAVPCLRLAFAIPNGGYRNKAEAARLKAEGVKSGVPDIMLPVARGQWHGLFVEMKKPKGGRLSDEQIEWGSDLQIEGFYWALCKTWVQAARVFQSFCDLPKKGLDTASFT